MGRWQRVQLVVIMLVLIAGCAGSDEASSGTPHPSSTLGSSAPSPSLPAAVLGFVEVKGAPYGIAAVGAALWVETDTEGAPGIARIDPSTRAVVATVAGAALPQQVANELWYVRGPRTLVRADPLTGAARARITVPSTGHFAVDRGAIWLAVGEQQGELLQVDARTGKLRSRLALPPGEPKDLVVYRGSVWVPVDGSDVLVQVDTTTGRQRAAIPAGSRPHSLAAGFGSLWVIDHGENALQRVDAHSGKVVATSTDAGTNVAVTASADAVWASSVTGLVQVRPATNTTGRSIEIPGMPELYDAAVLGDSVWVTAVDQRRVYQVSIS